MKTLKELREANKQPSYILNKKEKSTLEKDNDDKTFSVSDIEIPTFLQLQRKNLRIYPDGTRVAMYYIRKLDKYVTIPFGAKTMPIFEAYSVVGKAKKAISRGIWGDKAYKISRIDRRREKQKARKYSVHREKEDDDTPASERYQRGLQRSGAGGTLSGTLAYSAGFGLGAGIRALIKKKKSKVKPENISNKTPKETPKETPSNTLNTQSMAISGGPVGSEYPGWSASYSERGGGEGSLKTTNINNNSTTKQTNEIPKVDRYPSGKPIEPKKYRTLRKASDVLQRSNSLREDTKEKFYNKLDEAWPALLATAASKALSVGKRIATGIGAAAKGVGNAIGKIGSSSDDPGYKKEVSTSKTFKLKGPRVSSANKNNAFDAIMAAKERNAYLNKKPNALSEETINKMESIYQELNDSNRNVMIKVLSEGDEKEINKLIQFVKG